MRQRPCRRQLGVRSGGVRLGSGRCAGQDPFGRGGPPGAGRDGPEGQAYVPHDAVADVERGGQGADGEGVGGALAHLAVAGVGGDRGGRQGDAGDQRARRQGGLPVRGVADGQVEVGERQLAGSVRRFEVDHGVEGGQGHGHVRGVHGHAVVGGAQDGVVAVLARDGGAAAAGHPLVAGPADVREVAAAGALQQVSADGGHVAQLPRRPGQDRLGERRVAAPDLGVGGQVAVGDGGADPQPALGCRLDPVERQLADVDEPCGALDTGLHEVDEIGAAAEEAGVRVGVEQGDGAGDVVRPLVVELPHATVSFVPSARVACPSSG